MRTKIKNIQVGIIFLMLLASCAPFNHHLNPSDAPIKTFQYSENSPGDPVWIWAPTAQSKEQKVNSFLNTLNSYGGKYEIVEKELVPNPNYKLPRIKLYNIYTNEILNKRKGEFLEVYTLRSSEGKNPVYLYIATNKREKKIEPASLSYTSN